MRVEPQSAIDACDNAAPARWAGLVKHPRYLSAWSDDHVVIDVSHFQSRDQRTVTTHLGDMLIAGHGGASIHDAPVALAAYPHLVDSFKVAINMVVKQSDNGNVRAALRVQLNGMWQFTAWMFRNAVYRFSDVDRHLLDHFVEEIRKAQSWWDLLKYEESLEAILKKASSSAEFATALVTRHYGGSAINVDLLSSAIGLPLGSQELPTSFRERLAAIACVETPFRASTNIQDRRMGASRFRSCLSAIHAISGISAPFDRILWRPFPYPYRTARQLATKQTDGRTLNLGITEAAALISEALRWVYDYSPGILALLGRVRRELLASRDDVNSTTARARRIHAALPGIVTELREVHDFPAGDILTVDKTLSGGWSINSLVRTLQAACFVLVAINHGRRKNEVLGEGFLPYGLHFGCCTTLDEALQNFRIEIYIEKTYQDWHLMPCNVLVRDTVKVLEDIFQLHRPTEAAVTIPRDVDEARRQFLFSIPPLSGTLSPTDGVVPHASPYLHKLHSGRFLELCAVAPDALDATSHPFRRLFALLYFYRYDHARLRSLMQQLRHLNPAMTHIYVTDPWMRDKARTVEAVGIAATRDRADIERVWEEVRSEYFLDTLARILDGEAVGGLWPRLVMSQVKRLSKHVRFRDASTAEKADVLLKSYRKRGFSPEPKSHGTCMAGSAKRTAKASNCYDPADGAVHPEKATPRMCSGCVHLYTTPNHVHHQLAHLAELEGEATDFALPQHVRTAKATHAADLRQVVDKEQAMQKSNQKFLSECIVRFASAAEKHDAKA